MEVIDRGSNTFECILKGYTKGTAIDWVLEHFGMTRDQSYAFGDSSNDLAMFQGMPGMRLRWARMTRCWNLIQNLLQRPLKKMELLMR